MPEWVAFEEKIAKLSQFDRAVQKLRRIYVSGAVECDVDDSGRVLVPPVLREHAKLAKEVLWAGAGKYAELWDKAAWRQHFDTTEDERRDISNLVVRQRRRRSATRRHGALVRGVFDRRERDARRDDANEVVERAAHVHELSRREIRTIGAPFRVWSMTVSA